MSDPKFLANVRAAYDEYYLAKVKAHPESGYMYRTDTVKFIEWLETGKLADDTLPAKRKNTRL